MIWPSVTVPVRVHAFPVLSVPVPVLLITDFFSSASGSVYKSSMLDIFLLFCDKKMPLFAYLNCRCFFLQILGIGILAAGNWAQIYCALVNWARNIWAPLASEHKNFECLTQDIWRKDWQLKKILSLENWWLIDWLTLNWLTDTWLVDWLTLDLLTCYYITDWLTFFQLIDWQTHD